MLTVSRNEFQASISRPLGAIFASLLTCTETKMKKTNNNFYGRIRSIRKIQVIINYNYEAGAKRNIAKNINKKREEDNLPILIGQELEDTINEEYRRGTTWYRCLMDNKGRITPWAEGTSARTLGTIYLRAREMHKGSTLYIATEDIPFTSYKTGDEVPFEALEPYFLAYRPNKYDVEARTYKLNSIRAARFNHSLMYVVPSPNQEDFPRSVIEKVNEIALQLPEPQVA